MSTFDWESFLRQWSQALLESVEEGQEEWPPEAIESGWLGFPGATEAQIAQAEARLGQALPPSYRSFLKVSNGWRQTTPFIDRLWSTGEIEWFRVRHLSWIEDFVAPDRRSRVTENSSVPFSSIPDEEYLVYGEAQDCSRLRVEYLQTALEISRKGESAIYLLNPQIVTAQGEWEAWFFSDLLPGADRYRSFREMMEAEYHNFLEQRLDPRNERSQEPVAQPRNPIELTGTWRTFATFAVTFQVRQVEGRPEIQSTVYYQETDRHQTWSDLEVEQLNRWIQTQVAGERTPEPESE